MRKTEDVKSIFGRALEIGPAAERSAYLDQACGADADLRAEVDGLLAALQKAGNFLGRPAAGLQTTAAGPPAEGPGSRIGPYKLLEVIGEGGMGVVYVAEQEEPVRRRVALKVVKPGLDAGPVLARFEAERQALAMMDHPNVARMLDAGATDSGRPYFVMELVHGVPITRYCDDARLTPRERLELFVPVCQAIQHAHQKGIIHRDIKPSNVLVTLYDGTPVPKVIDFGVAKATEHRLTERTLFTQYGTVVGTWEYMSPEQAEMSALGVDTRSDVYSLGVLLYELLTGSTPLERGRLLDAALGEMLRLIRDEEPPPPSRRLGTSAKLPAVAAARRTEPQTLTRLVEGELDWIVMKCLEKDRTRRYGTASDLARDVERHLADEPVEAGPPSPAYRLRKAAHKYRKALLTAAAFALLVVSAAAVSVGLAVRAARAEAEARRAEAVAQERLREALEQRGRANEEGARAGREEAMSGEMQKLLHDLLDTRGAREAMPALRPGIDRAARRLDREPPASPAAEALVRDAVGCLYLLAGDPAAASPHLLRALRLHRENPDHDQSLGTYFLLEGVLDGHAARREWDKAEALVEAWSDVLRRLPTPDLAGAARVSARRGEVRVRRGDHAGAEAVLRESLAALQRAGADEQDRWRVRFWLGRALAGQKRYAEAEPLLLGWHARLGQWEKGFFGGFVRPDVPEAMRSLAALYDAWGKPDRAKEWRRKLEEFEKQQHGQ